jgi:uncharacterized membrane protein
VALAQALGLFHLTGMPYRWLPPPGTGAHLRLWPHRSLTRRGFAGFIAATAVLIFLPAVTLLGSPAAWAVLGFAALALAGVWTALRRSERDSEIVEDLTIRADCMDLIRTGPRGRRQTWQANPHWVEVRLYPTSGPVPQYLTLRGAGREVELGAFLTEAERLALADDLRAALAARR